MKLMLIKMMMLWSSISLIMKTPMSLGLILLMQTTTMIIFMNKILQSSWFPMITFMMMIGGLLIMFMYMSSIASNEKFKIKINLTLLLFMVMIIIDEMMIENQINEDMNILSMSNLNLSLTKIYNKKSMMLTIMLVLYLLLTMISITKMVKHNLGPLRKMN